MSLEINNTDNYDIDAYVLWDYILKDLKKKMTTPAFEMAIKPLGVKSFENGMLTLITNNPMWCKAIKNKYSSEISIALQKYSRNPEALFEVILDKTFTSKYILEQDKSERKTSDENATQAQLPLNEVQIDALKFLSSYGINVKYDFDNFVVSKSNKLAYGASKQVSQEPGKIYNPLFIWGGAGLGKTHLVNAIGKNILIKHPELKLKYVTMNDFTTEFTKIVYQYKNDSRIKNEFVNKYRNVDVLLIDDVQFLEGREATQTEIFNIFDYLHRNGKQIVLTSDKQPKDIPTLTDRLRSRFEWGMIAEIKPPDLETRKEILKLKAKEENIVVPDEVIDVVASAFNQNVRELEGALSRLAGYASIEEKPITLEDAREVLNLDALNKKLTVDDVINIVADYYKLEPAEIKGDCRAKEIVIPRYISIYLARELVKSSLPQIALVFGNRTHSTILYGYEKIKQAKEQDYNLKQIINGLQEKIEREYFII